MGRHGKNCGCDKCTTSSTPCNQSSSAVCNKCHSAKCCCKSSSSSSTQECSDIGCKTICFGHWGAPRCGRERPSQYEQCDFSKILSGSLVFAFRLDAFGATRSLASGECWNRVGIVLQAKYKKYMEPNNPCACRKKKCCKCYVKIQPWHSAVEFKRYLVRFTHMVSGFNTLTGIMRTVYNQYDSMVRPLHKWLEERGVNFMLETTVTDLVLLEDRAGFAVDKIVVQENGVLKNIRVTEDDKVIVTLGSMTEGSSLGSMDSAATLLGKTDGGSWALWERIAAGQTQFGHPSNFADHVEQSKWMSFTTTLHDPTLFELIRDLTGNVPGEGGLITFPESSWLASIVLPHQPHFIGQPEGVHVFWGYGLFVDIPGNFVKKPMSACTGREIMTEILGHLRLQAHTARILDACTCIPCMMPFITSQFLPRSKGDRAMVRPDGSKNLAFVGQFCEASRTTLCSQLSTPFVLRKWPSTRFLA